MKPSIVLLVPLVFLACRPATDQVADASAESSALGQLNHQFSISEPASAGFEKGLLLLHSFEYEDAREAFQEALAADSSEFMAYWGEAMTHYRALWGLQDVEAGRAVMDRLGATEAERLQKAENELERDFWKGVEILYGEGELYERNQAYAEYMGALYEKHPKNQEIAAFYALGLMWSVPLGRDSAIFDRSARIAAGVLQENPSHPGALHYMIHAYDDPRFAQLAIDAADLYAQVAPDATHALHMPSHIYLALGMWDEVVASNEASYQASLNRLARKGLGDESRGYHSYSWLHYGYLQQGRNEDALRLLTDMVGFTQKAPTIQARSYWIAMKNAYLAEVGTWHPDVKTMRVNLNDLGLISKATHRFFTGRLAYQSGDSQTLAAEIDTLNTEIAAAELLVTSDGITLCDAGITRYAPNRTDIQRATVILYQLSAYQALIKNDVMSAEKFLKEATALEQKTTYSFGPPDIPFPSFEQYGDWLLEEGRYPEALEQFELSLQRAPQRSHALKGKLQALMALGRDQEADEVQQELETIVKATS